MKKTLATLTVLLAASSANAFSIQQFCEDKYLSEYGYSQVEWCVNKHTQSARNLVAMNDNNGWKDEFVSMYNMCLGKYFTEYGPTQVEWCLKKEIKAWNRMNPYELINSGN